MGALPRRVQDQIKPQALDTASTSSGSAPTSDTFSSIEYPVPWIVKNTFVEVPLGKSLSMEAFFTEREVRSAPVSGILDENSSPNAVGPTPAIAGKVSNNANVQPSPVVLQLAQELVLEQRLDSGEYPSVGSKGHHQRICKPCAFNWSDKGCQNGLVCTFCHICGPGERRRRKKEKRHVRNAMIHAIKNIQLGWAGPS